MRPMTPEQFSKQAKADYGADIKPAMVRYFIRTGQINSTVSGEGRRSLHDISRLEFVRFAKVQGWTK